jgi:hypothetical protein
MPGEQMFHQGVNCFVLGAREFAILIEREILGSANFSCLSERRIGVLQDPIQRITLNFCGHGAKFYNAEKASQWYEGTKEWRGCITSLFLSRVAC